MVLKHNTEHKKKKNATHHSTRNITSSKCPPLRCSHSASRSVLTLPPYFLTAEPVSSKLLTHVFMAWADGTLLLRRSYRSYKMILRRKHPVHHSTTPFQTERYSRPRHLAASFAFPAHAKNRKTPLLNRPIHWRTLYNLNVRQTIAWTPSNMPADMYFVLKRFSCKVTIHLAESDTFYRGADESLARPGRKQPRKHVRDARDFDIETLAVIKFFFPAWQGAEGNSRHSDRNISLFPSWSG